MLKKISMIAAFAVVTLSSAVFADQHAAVIDARNNVVVDTRGACVLTNWDEGHACAGFVAKSDNSVFFATDSAVLDDVARATLGAIAEEEAGNTVTLTGYADKRGSTAYNDALARKRAENVKAYLAARGVEGEVAVVGEARPITFCDGKDGDALANCLAADRRVDVE